MASYFDIFRPFTIQNAQILSLHLYSLFFVYFNMKNLKILHQENLIFNLDFFKNKKDDLKICAMVKSNAYGHGMKEIAQMLEDKVDMFGVVNVEEGKILRKFTEKPILICSHVEDFAGCKKYGLDVEIASAEELLLGFENLLSMHLKLNCGMNRYGCKDFQELSKINDILQNKDIKLASICTHFPQTENRKRTMKAYENFMKMYAEISEDAPICFGGSNLANYPFQFDILRLGIGLYGYGESGLLPVMEIKSHVVNIVEVEKGEFVGYGTKFRAKKKQKIAVVPVGYGDGLRRNLSGNFCVQINGKKYRSVGNICMDAFFVLIDESVSVGDEVAVMNDAQEFADKIGTIPYEILTGLGTFRGKTVIK